MSPELRVAHRVHLSFPRVSGDEPRRAGRLLLHLMFSPRERG